MDASIRDGYGWHAPAALLPDGWHESVDLEVSADGVFSRIVPDSQGSTLPALEGPVVPGMVNVHSHAFQRALIGRTQSVSPEDDFWSWRSICSKVRCPWRWPCTPA